MEPNSESYLSRKFSNLSFKSNHITNPELKRFGHTMTLSAKSINDLYNDIYTYNVKETTWTKLNPTGHVPSPRAAHSACSIDNYNLLIFGGAKKNGGFSSNELYRFDLSNGEDKPSWYIMECKDIKPGRRYGHTMISFKSNIILFGGILKEKNRITNEIWILNIENYFKQNENTMTNNYTSVENKYFTWKLINLDSHKLAPRPRMYHSCGICKTGKAKGMITIFGGRGENGDALNELWGLRKHRSGDWEWVLPVCDKSTIPLRRYQHSAIFYTNFMIVLGGRGDTTDDYDNFGMPIEIFNTQGLTWVTNLNFFDKFRHATFLIDKFGYAHGGCSYSRPSDPNENIEMFDVQQLCYNFNSRINKKLITYKNGKLNVNTDTNKILNMKFENLTSLSDYKPIILKNGDISSIKKDFSFSQTRANANISFINNASIKKISLKDENKFKTINDEDENFELYKIFINTLLKPSEWRIPKKDDEPMGLSKFRFRREHIVALTRACQEIVASQPMVLKINSPVKIFGDIHGQYEDLMRFFDYWGEPSDKPGVGDIHSIDYLFLGDYVDRGTKSLETICLIMALKIKYPDRIHLIRGNHEDYLINSIFGFLDECDSRLLKDKLDEDINVYKILNEFFEYLPLAAVIEDKILCLHGGIGGNLTSIKEIEEIARPLKVVHEATSPTEQIVMDILWSDPTDNDEELGIKPNTVRDSKSFGNIVKFGPDIVRKFLIKNNLSMIIRAHECVVDGFERFCEGKLITLFSATDYCKKHKNAGAMLIVNNFFEIIPHLIYPDVTINNNWIMNEEFMLKRPPTPLKKKNTSNLENVISSKNEHNSI